MDFNVRHLVEQIIVDHCAGQLQQDEIEWPFDDSLLVYLIAQKDVDFPPYGEEDIEIRQESPGHIFIRTFTPRPEYSSGMGTSKDSETYDLYQEDGLCMFIKNMQILCGGNKINLYIDGSTGRK